MSPIRNTRAHSFISGMRDELAFSVRKSNSASNLDDAVVSVPPIHIARGLREPAIPVRHGAQHGTLRGALQIRRRPVPTSNHVAQISSADAIPNSNVPGDAAAAQAQVSGSAVRRERRDSVLEDWLIYDAYLVQQSSTHHQDMIPTSLRSGSGAVNDRAGARALHLHPVPQAQHNPDTTQSDRERRRLPDSSRAYTQPYNRNLAHGQQLSPPQLPNTTTGNFLNHDEFSFDVTRFHYPAVQISGDERSNRPANVFDYMEARQLDPNVAEHLRFFVPEPFFAPWDYVVQGVRKAMSSYLWGA